MNGQKDRCLDKKMHWQTVKETDRQVKNEWMHKQQKRQTVRQKGERTHGQIVQQARGERDGKTDKGVKGQMHKQRCRQTDKGETDRQTKGQMDRHKLSDSKQSKKQSGRHRDK